MEINYSYEVLDISVLFSGSFYLLNVEVGTFYGNVSRYLSD